MEAGAYAVPAIVVDNGKGKRKQMTGCETAFSVTIPEKAVTASNDRTQSTPAATEAKSSAPVEVLTPRGEHNLSVPPSVRNQATAPATTVTEAKGIVPVETATANDQHSTSAPASKQSEVTAVSEKLATVNNDHSANTSSTAPGKVTAPVAAWAAPHPRKFGSIQFKRDVKRPTRVNNEAKGELDRYADALSAQPDVRSVVVGHVMARENQAKAGSHKKPEFAARRAVNTKDYLVRDQGVDPARIEPRTGRRHSPSVDLWIIPAGTQLTDRHTARVDEGRIKAVRRVALKRKVHRNVPKQQAKSLPAPSSR